MKTYVNKILLLGLITGIISCETEDKIVDVILEDVGTGAVLRTRDETNNLVFNDETDAFDDDASYSVVLEAQDVEGGTLLQSVDISVAFDDNSLTEEEEESDDALKGMSTALTPLETLSADDFANGERGLPETTISYTADELIAATGIDESMVVGKDRFEFQLTLTLTNGEVYTSDDVGGPVSGGAYFSAPFEYFPVISCSITESLAGTHSYVTTEIIPAPPGTGTTCSGSATGTLTWEETDTPGVYVSSDMSFGQFGDCYDGRGDATGNDIEIEWDCTNLVPDGEVYLKDGVVIPDDDNEDEEITYNYSITNVDGPDMTISFSNSLGDRGVVVLTRENNEDWPVIFLANNE